jgi:DNA-directed RNA polymerase sigma subunit (sigma70/sigma32)
LSPHERDVIRLRHGLDDGRSRTTREVSEALTISLTDVRRSETSAFRKLRSPYSVHTYHLLGFLDYVGLDPEASRAMYDDP